MGNAHTSDVGMYDRVVIQDILKEIAQTQQVDLNAKQRFKGELHLPSASEGKTLIPVVIINEADGLTRDAQAALRRTMEKYMTNMRLILCANSTSKIIAPIRSRCLLVRVAAPTNDEVSPAVMTWPSRWRNSSQMSKVLHHVAKRERFALPDPACDSIISSSDGNLRKALLVFEALKMQRPDLTGDLDVAKPDWETYCVKIADSIIQDQSAQRLLEVRAKLYELISHCIPPTVVLKTISERIVDRVDEKLKPQMVHWAAYYVSLVYTGDRLIGRNCECAKEQRRSSTLRHMSLRS